MTFDFPDLGVISSGLKNSLLGFIHRTRRPVLRAWQAMSEAVKAANQADSFTGGNSDTKRFQETRYWVLRHQPIGAKLRGDRHQITEVERSRRVEPQYSITSLTTAQTVR